MLKTLKRKFILVNMGLVLAVLTAVAVVSLVSAVQEFRSNYQQTLQNELGVKNGESKKYQFSISKKGDRNGAHAQVSNPFSFSAVRDESGQWTLSSSLVSVDEDTFQTLVQRAEAAELTQGFFADYAAAYEKTDGRIAFVGLQNEYQQLKKQAVTTGLVYLGAGAAFFLISCFLSGWVVAPVEKSWKQQRQFVADASHELKTPLTVILANTSIMEKELGENVWLAIVQKESLRMKGLVEDMLFLAHSDAVAQPLPQTPVALSDLVWEEVLSFEVVAFEKEISMESDIESGCSTVGDAAQLRQLVGILLDNAVKYSPAGGCVRLRMHAARERLILTVQNGGEPIAPEHLKRLFDRFYRVDEARQEGGYGLGLAIAKQIVAGHHGELSAESSLADGTVFTVTLPRCAEKK